MPDNQLQPINIENKILVIRGLQVMLDRDLAELYGVETKRLNEQVRRNKERFPEEFYFQLTDDEQNSLRSQIATLKNSIEHTAEYSLRGKHTKYRSYVFTEQGVAMLSTVLKSETAVNTTLYHIGASLKDLGKKCFAFEILDSSLIPAIMGNL